MAEDKNPTDEQNPDIALEEALVEELDERDLEITDTALRNSVVFKDAQALRHVRCRKLVRMVEKRQGMCVWVAGDAVTLRVVASSPSRPG